LGFSDRDIYNKQNPQYNIINFKPKSFRDEIKQYPKITLEDQDAYYFKRLEIMKQQEKELEGLHRSNQSPTTLN
jgi:hypothetical protein